MGAEKDISRPAEAGSARTGTPPPTMMTLGASRKILSHTVASFFK
jgi:hypothetical protein